MTDSGDALTSDKLLAMVDKLPRFPRFSTCVCRRERDVPPALAPFYLRIKVDKWMPPDMVVLIDEQGWEDDVLHGKDPSARVVVLKVGEVPNETP